MRHPIVSLAMIIASLASGRCLAGPPRLVVVPDDAPTVQAAIDLVEAGGDVIVTPGIYHERLDMRGKALRLRSSAPQDLRIVATTIIDASAFDTSVVTCSGGERADTIIDGLTLRGGCGTAVLVQPKFGTVVRFGGGLYIDGASPTIRRCVVRENFALDTPGFPPQPGQGGGIYVAGGSPVISSCILFANGAGRGGGLLCFDGAVKISNSVFVANNALAIESVVGSLDITSCTFTGNTGGIVLNGGGTRHTLTNNIHWANGAEITTLVGGIDLVVTSCTVAGGWPGDGHIDADPLFMDAAGFDFRLLAGSPCIDAADNTAVPTGTSVDVLGALRFVDDPDTVDTGTGDAPIVDMGAYEFQPLGVDCPADFDGDGSVGFTDLTTILASWGRCRSCPADIDGDGDVGFVDLTFVLAGWGDCP